MVIDWSQILPDSIVAFFTILFTLIGIGIGFKLNKSQHNKLEKTEAKRLLFLLKKDVELNENLLSQLREAIKKNETVFYNVSLVVWNSITPSLARVLKTLEIKDISEFYFQLQHVSRKVDMIFQMTFTLDLKKQETKEKIQLLINSLNQHIPAIFEGTICLSPKTIIAKIDCLMKKLED